MFADSQSSDSDCILYKEKDEEPNETHLFLEKDIVGSNDDELRLEDTLKRIQKELNYSVLQKCFLKRSMLGHMADHPRFCEFAEGSFVGFRSGRGEPLLSRVHRCFKGANQDSWKLELQVLEPALSNHDDSMSVSDNEGADRNVGDGCYQVMIRSCQMQDLSDKLPDGSSLTEFLRRLAISTKGFRGSSFRSRSQAIVTLFPRALDEPEDIGNVLQARCDYINDFSFTEVDVTLVLNEKKKEQSGSKSKSTVNLEIEKEELESMINLYKEKLTLLEKAVAAGGNEELSSVLSSNKKELKRILAEHEEVTQEIRLRREQSTPVNKGNTPKGIKIQEVQLPECEYWETRIPMSSFYTKRTRNKEAMIISMKALYNRVIQGPTSTEPKPDTGEEGEEEEEVTTIPKFDPLKFSYVS